MLALFAIGAFGLLNVLDGLGDGLFGGSGDAAADAGGASASPTPGEDLFDDDDARNAEPAIEATVRAGALRGCGEDGARTFCPDQPITRAEFAVALDALLAPPEAEQAFEDVPADAPFAGAVARLAAQGVVSGCAETRFCPDAPVTRAQAAALVARTIDLPAEPVERFEDVPEDSVFAEVVGRMAGQGIMAGCSEDPRGFCPDEALVRADAATLLVGAGLVG